MRCTGAADPGNSELEATGGRPVNLGIRRQTQQYAADSEFNMADEFEGYCLDDITYCIDPKTNEFFPVRVVKAGRRFLDVVALNDELALTIAPEFNAENKNRRFIRPKLPNISRFGGFDERTVNSERQSGQELRILPFHYWTYTGNAIIERNADDPEAWPISTGIVYERWFKQALEKKQE